MERDRLGMWGGCSAMSWRTEDGRQLMGRNFDFNRIARGSAVTYIPPGSRYCTCAAERPEGRRELGHYAARYGAVGMGLLLPTSLPVLYEGINPCGLMGGQLYYRGFAHYAETAREGTEPLQAPMVVYHLLAQCDSIAQVKQVLERQVTLVNEPMLGAVAPLHWFFCDGTGESVVIESDRDGLKIYDAPLGVMTNSPGYAWHRLNLLNYAGLRDLDYDGLEMGGERLEQCFSGSGAQGLPGDWSSPSRFVRLAFLKQHAARGRWEEEGVSRLFRLLQSVSFPMGAVRVSQPGEPVALEENVLPWDYTIYTSVMCAQSLRFYWSTYSNPAIRYVDLRQLEGEKKMVQFPLEEEVRMRCLSRQED